MAPPLHHRAADYGRDEKFQRHYAEAAGDPETWQKFVDTYLSGSEEDYQAARQAFQGGSGMSEATRAEVCAVACAELFRDAGEIMASRDVDDVFGRCPAGAPDLLPDLVLSDGEALLMADTPAIGAASPIEGWMPVPARYSTWWPPAVAMSSWAPTRLIATAIRTSRRFGPLQHPTRPDVRGTRRPGQHDQPRPPILGGPPTRRACSGNSVDVSPVSHDRSSGRVCRSSACK
ncbi:hypothetical protein I541_5733 [Mycobacteroides abscessus]|nr:hypothetical protein I541_5733 [Mycobacteroides abscessus]